MNVVEWALLEGNEIGVTVHFIDSGIDTGAIVLTKAVTPAIQDTSLSALSQRIVYITVDALVEAVRQLAKEEAGEMRQPAGGGKQYFVMHEKLRSLAEQQLTDRRNRYSA
jgi:folate-dependent phosphoribosylglycinamide formyltransferase PurN